jgi:mannose-6-phosphate isomerase-like protein (cupin superfamily)
MNAALMAEVWDRATIGAMSEAVWFLGDLIEIRLGAERTDGAFCVLEDHPAPGFAPVAHIHRDEDEIVHVLEGEFVLETHDGRQELVVGETVWIPKGTLHAFHNVGASAGHRLVTFVPAGPERLYREFGTAAPDAPPPDRARLADAAARYGFEFKS